MISWLMVGLLALQGAGAPTPATPGEGESAAVTQAADDPALEAAYVRVSRQLRCPVCQQLSILDSPAELAREMRGLVRERLAAGDSEDEVLAYFVSKYGQWVLLDPPKRGFNLVVWITPLLLLVGGAVVLAKVFSGWLGAAEPEEPAAAGRSTG